MNRASCGHENPAQAKFCLECGGRLGHRCAACNAQLPRGAKFCLECGTPAGTSAPGPFRDPRSYTPKHLTEKILTSRSTLEGERKQVTVLFADVKGSMDLAEQVDPEEWHKIMDRFFAILSEGVHRFEGTINQYTGDGIMALFGAPRTKTTHSARVMPRCTFSRNYGAMRMSCVSSAGLTSSFEWVSTPATLSSERSETTCGWTTRHRDTRSASLLEWNRSPSRVSHC